MDSIDETPEERRVRNAPAQRRFGGMVYMLIGLAILAYAAPEIAAGKQDRDKATGVIKRFARLSDEPSDAQLSADRHDPHAPAWIAYKSAVTRVRIAGALAFIGGLSLTGGISLFLRAR